MYTCIDTTKVLLYIVPGLVEALAIKSGGIDTPIHDLHGLVEALTIKSGGIDTRIHDFPGLVEALAIKCIMKWWYRYTYT